MVRTTPPRPVEISRHFPELAPLARTAVRLHPRTGTPTAADSSIGGPLLWPAGEPWPVCPDHAGPSHVGSTPDNARRHRRLLSWRAQSGEDVSALLRQIPYQEEIAQDGPLPLLPVAQLYAADVPGLPCPDGADLLQVLWCSFTDHDEPWVPRTVLRWRTAAEVRDPLAAAPQPCVISHGNYLPEPCVLDPETVTEYPNPQELPHELRQRIEAWQEQHGVNYHDHLSIPGLQGRRTCPLVGLRPKSGRLHRMRLEGPTPADHLGLGMGRRGPQLAAGRGIRHRAPRRHQPRLGHQALDQPRLQPPALPLRGLMGPPTRAANAVTTTHPHTATAQEPVR
ncbi:hypothetical protein EDD99_0196 [Streptomyces sp. 846.5]|nr:hypothetical protein EDD99_0196 [Streptomyces sp. 846.5]